LELKPVTPVSPSPGYYREERTWDQRKMRIVTKKVPCSFQEMLESANEERKRIEALDSEKKVRSAFAIQN
jgi:hypothetical protein